MFKLLLMKLQLKCEQIEFLKHFLAEAGELDAIDLLLVPQVRELLAGEFEDPELIVVGQLADELN